MHQALIVLVWALLSGCVALIGRMIENENVLNVGAIMLVFTCAFAC